MELIRQYRRRRNTVDGLRSVVYVGDRFGDLGVRRSFTTHYPTAGLEGRLYSRKTGGINNYFVELEDDRALMPLSLPYKALKV